MMRRGALRSIVAPRLFLSPDNSITTAQAEDVGGRKESVLQRGRSVLLSEVKGVALRQCREKFRFPQQQCLLSEIGVVNSQWKLN